MFSKIWAVIATVVAVFLFVLHFVNPLPLFQFPDLGHRIIAVPEEYRVAVVQALQLGDLRPYGTFTAGIKQTLMGDGRTVVASGGGMRPGGVISLPVFDPETKALAAQELLESYGIHTTIRTPEDSQLIGKIAVVRLPFGVDIVYRVSAHKMPYPKWQDDWRN